MGLFDSLRKKKVIDLSERYKEMEERKAQIQEESQNESSQGQESAFSFFDNPAASSKPDTLISGRAGESIEERRRKLTKRLSDMTSKIEEISNQIYHLQQRIELLEKKMDVRRE